MDRRRPVKNYISAVLDRWFEYIGNIESDSIGEIV